MLQKGIQNGSQNHLKPIQKVVQNSTPKKVRKSMENEFILASFSLPLLPPVTAEYGTRRQHNQDPSRDPFWDGFPSENGPKIEQKGCKIE